ncbi:hypothetical protein [Acinetobacter bereziniae]|uniref:hypothetical protein n=1 Tax=Acinetobacter bereziniae TaxID=106648 RepID=UPI003018D66E
MNDKQIANIIFEKIRDAAKNKSDIKLNPEEVEILAGELGNFRYVPVYSMQDIPRLIDEGIIKTRKIKDNE